MLPLELNISTSGFTEVGQSFNITCSVRVVEGLVEQPNVTWMKMDDVSMGDLDELNIPTITVIDGSVTNVTVILDPVLFEHRGVYICMAEFNISLTIDADSDSQEYELIVDCKFFLTLYSSFFHIEFKSYFVIYYFIFLSHCHKYMMYSFLFLSDIDSFLLIFISGGETVNHIRALSDKCSECIYMYYSQWCRNS